MTPTAKLLLASIVGILLRTVAPYLEAALKQIKETGEIPSFDVRKFWLPPTAAFLLGFLQYGVVALTSPGMMEDLSQMPFFAIILAVYGEQSVVRLAQKFVGTLIRKST